MTRRGGRCRSRTTSCFLALAAILALAGCAGAAIVHGTDIDDGYSTAEIGYAAGGGGLGVEVIGNPFGGDDAAFAAAVADAIQGANSGPRVRFVPPPEATPRPEYRLRMIFNGPEASRAGIFCAGTPTVPASAGAEDLRVLAGFCRGDRALTYLAASTGPASGPDDPAFRYFLRQVTAQALPANRGFPDSDQCKVPGC
jgi:hypothetical protein